MRIVQALLAAVAAAAILSALGPDVAEAQTKVTVGKVVGGVGLHIPSYIAMDKGFFKDEGAGRAVRRAGGAAADDGRPVGQR